MDRTMFLRVACPECSPVRGCDSQMTATESERLDLEHYLSKTYCKTASLMANSAKAVAVLGDQSPEVSSSEHTYHSRLRPNLTLRSDHMMWPSCATLA